MSNVKCQLRNLFVQLCLCLVAQLLPTISIHPADAVLSEGATYVFDCVVDAATREFNVTIKEHKLEGLYSIGSDVQIRWAHNGVVLESDATRQLLPNNSLRITNVDATTIGQYACLVSSSVGNVTSRQASLQLACELVVILYVITIIRCAST